MHKLSTTLLAAATVFASVGCHATPTTTDSWSYLDNGSIRIGVDRSRGACIGYFGESQTQRNLLNHYDEGRFIQQSYYGQTDGSDWDGKPWVYNPIQGGSYKRVPAKVDEFKLNKTPAELSATITPRHWASGELCPEMVMKQSIKLEGDIASLTFMMSYTGPDQGEPRHQEMPAVFVDGALKNFVYTKEGVLTRAAPRIHGEGGRDGVDGLGIDQSSSEWVAYVDDNDWGIGIYTPGTPEFTCYRALGDGTTGPSGSACSYVSPIRTFALTTGLELEYTVYLTIGTLTEIQERFAALQ